MTTMPVHPPRLVPLDVHHAPELAVLSALDHTLQAARVALLVHNPEIFDPEPLTDPDPYAQRVRELAVTLVERFDELGSLLADYRAALRRQRAAQGRASRAVDF